MSVTAVYSDDLSRVRITCAGAPAHADYATIERSTDGITWSTVRGGDTVALSGGACALDDYEFAPSVLNTYKASYVDTAIPAWTGLGTVATANNAPVVPALPTGLAVGDLMLCSVGSAGASATFATPAGWTSYMNMGNTRAFARLYVPGDTAPTLTPSGGASGNDVIARIASFRNVTTATATTQTNTSAQNVAAPAMPVPAVDTLVVRVASKLAVATTATQVGWGSVSADSGTSSSLLCLCTVASADVPAASIVVTGGTSATSKAATIRFDRAPYVARETGTVTPALSSVWIKNPQRPYLNRRLTVVDWSSIDRPARTGVFDVVGRSYPVAVTELRGSRRFTLTATTTTLALAADLDGCLSAGEPVLLHCPPDAPFPTIYAVVGDTSITRGTSRRSQRRYHALPLTEVAAPAGTLIGTTVSWQGVISAFASWADLLVAEPTWSDVLDRIGTPSDVIVA